MFKLGVFGIEISLQFIGLILAVDCIGNFQGCHDPFENEEIFFSR
jgi:hypothetical protein